MRIGGGSSQAKLTVALDIRHPFAYLALGPTIELGQDADIAIDWLPASFPTLRRPSVPGGEDDRGVRHKRKRAQMIAREIAVYAEAQGLRIEEPYRDAPATAIQLSWLWVRATAPESLEPFLEHAFRRYWSLDLDAGSIDPVSDLVARCGLDAEAFREWSAGDGAAAVEAVSEELTELGVFQAPAFLVEDEVFYGRQHLPMIRWLLEGRQGSVPI